MLKVKNLETGYGKKQVIFGLSLEVKQGERVALIGPNGSGKSTVLKSICGLLPVWSGQIYLQGNLINDSTPAQNVVNIMTFAPQAGSPRNQ